jgi:5-methylcytosine-specific restriction endonuclease McrA
VTSNRNFSRSVKRAAYARANGCCESCGVYLPAGFGGIVYDHRIPWKLSEDSSIDNCQMLCTACDSAKTYGKDLTEIAKVTRVADARIGITRASKKLPAGRNSGIKKKINGEVVTRRTGNEQHWDLMAKRRIGAAP